MSNRIPDSFEAVLLTPLGRDAMLAADCLRMAGIEAVPCRDFEELSARVRAGVGTVLVTEEALTVERVRAFGDLVQEQPAWSDLPIVVFSSRLDTLRSRTAHLQELGNVSFVDRPVQRRTLVAAVRSALRARQRQYEGRRAIEAREQFLAMLGHELRNPLAAIVFATDLLGRGNADNPRLAKYTATVERQTRHLHRLVDDLLDVGRVTSGKVTLKREPVEMAALVRRSIEAHQVMAEAHGVSLIFTDDGTPVVVDADVVRLEQVATNLVTNALKYTPRGGRVAVRVGREGGQAVLSVQDTGLGIAAENLGSIFELFAQAPTTLDRARGGLGLGLTLVRTLVELQGGTVAADSPGVGLGSRFQVRLPLVVVDVVPASSKHGFPTPMPGRPRKRIVVVDDNADLREMLAELLGMVGYVVEEAGDGPQGLTRILSVRPDVALVDIGLPGFDGYELARQARRSLGDSVLLIAMTGYGQLDDQARAAEAGFDSHITKPVSLEDIEAAVAAPPSRSAPPAA